MFQKIKCVHLGFNIETRIYIIGSWRKVTLGKIILNLIEYYNRNFTLAWLHLGYYNGCSITVILELEYLNR